MNCVPRLRRCVIFPRPWYDPSELIANLRPEQDIVGDLDTEDEDLLEARLRVFAELAKSAPDAFETCSDQVIVFVLRDVLTISPDPDEVSKEYHFLKPVVVLKLSGRILLESLSALFAEHLRSTTPTNGQRMYPFRHRRA